MSKKKKILLFTILILVSTTAIYFSFIKKVSGRFNYSSPARDDQFGVSVNTPILIRKVELVQYHKNEDGEVELVFSNYHLDSFDEYINPDFPEDITSKVFYSDDIKFLNYDLTNETIKAIAYNDEIDKVDINDFQLDRDISEYNLVYTDGALVSASNEWKIGEIKITYSYIDPLKEYIIKAFINNNTITSNIFFKIISE